MEKINQKKNGKGNARERTSKGVKESERKKSVQDKQKKEKN